MNNQNSLSKYGPVIIFEKINENKYETYYKGWHIEKISYVTALFISKNAYESEHQGKEPLEDKINKYLNEMDNMDSVNVLKCLEFYSSQDKFILIYEYCENGKDFFFFKLINQGL
jgi:serine/threonine protein kinase